MAYSVKEIYSTIQGEGLHTGRPSVFLRFSGCNLWSGREEDRKKSICDFCDTDFLGTDGENGDKYGSPEELAQIVGKLWIKNSTARPFVVCTGGEPLLQLDQPLIQALHRFGFEIAVETNGTLKVPTDIDWITVSPKANAEIVQKKGDELKFVFPQEDLDPRQFDGLDFGHFFIQPMDGPDLEHNTALATEFCRNNPIWRLSIQMHKVIGVR